MTFAPGNPCRSAGCSRPPRRARNRSTGRRHRRSTGCGAARRAALATHIARCSCPDIRRRGGSGSGRDIARARRHECGRSPACAATGRRSRRRSGFSAGPDIARKARRRGRRRSLRIRRHRPGRGVQPRFFHRSIRPASWRAGQRFSSRFAAWISCLRTRSWSSVSRMVKFDCRPTSSAWLRSIFAATEWKVPSQGIPSIAPPESAPTRSRISRAALLVKVTARIWLGHALRVAMRCARRAVSAAVLPVPAPARTSTGPSVVSTASRCGAFRPCR